MADTSRGCVFGASRFLMAVAHPTPPLTTRIQRSFCVLESILPANQTATAVLAHRRSGRCAPFRASPAPPG